MSELEEKSKEHGVLPQFSRNIGIISPSEQITLFDKHVALFGLGCIGDIVAESLSRLGVGEMTIVDQDKFDVTNINRQIYATYETVGQNKVLVTEQRLKSINPYIKINKFDNFVTAKNAKSMIEKADLVISAVDSPIAMIYLARACEELEKYYMVVYGAMPPLHGSLTTFDPSKKVKFEKLMNFPTSEMSIISKETEKSVLYDIRKGRAKSAVKRGVNPDFWYEERLSGGPVPTLCTASNITGLLASQEALKILTGKYEPVFAPNILHFDGVNNRMYIDQETDQRNL